MTSATATLRLALVALALAACRADESVRAPRAEPPAAVGSDRAPVPVRAQAQPSDFAGRWESVGTSGGGLGGVLDLALDGGTYAGGVVVMVDGPYAVRGTRLVTGPPGDDAEQEFAVAGDRMTVGGPSSSFTPEDVARVRVGKATPGASPIVGVWTYLHDTGARAFERYGQGGRMEFRLAMPGARRGRWAVDVEYPRLVFETEGGLDFVAVRRDGDVWTLDGYRRADRWYDFPMSDADVARMVKRLGEEAPTAPK